MADLWTVAQGLSSAWTITLRDADGEVYTTFTGTEALAGSIRAGRDSEPLVTLAPVWLVAGAGTITVPISGTAIADLDVGRYVVQVKLADDSAELYEGFLEITYSPGSAADLPSYASFGEMLDRAPWIEKLQRTTDLAGFARQRAKARQWFETLLHRHYRGGSGISTDVAFGCIGEYRDGRRSKDLQDWLDDDLLDVTEDVIEAVTYHAIAQLCDRQVSPAGKDADFSYAALARKYFARAEAAAASITAEIDSNDDGVNDLVIRLGVTDTLEG